MGKMRKTYTIDFKLKAVGMYLNDKLGYKTVARELDINDKMVRRWVAHYEREGLTGLEEKRGKTSGRAKGHSKSSKSMSMEEELVRLRAENEYLKKLWALQRGQSEKRSTNTPS